VKFGENKDMELYEKYPEFLDLFPEYGFNIDNSSEDFLKNQEFFEYLIKIFENNWIKIENTNVELYQIAFKSFYDLYVVFIFIKIWQIKKENSSSFYRVFKTFSSQEQNKLNIFNNLFKLSELKESEIFKFLSVLNFHGNELKEFGKLVNQRNNCSHPSGFIQYTQSELNTFNNEIICFCKKIINKFRLILFNLFKQFLIDNSNYLKEDFSKEDFDEFIKINYISKFEIKMLFEFVVDENITYFKGEINKIENNEVPIKQRIKNIKDLNVLFKKVYADDSL